MNAGRARRTRRRAFTLVELLVVLAATAVLAQGFYVWKRAAVGDSLVERAVEAFATVDEAVYGFRVDNPGTWPTSVNPGLAGYLGSGTAAMLAARGFRLAVAGPNSLRIIGDMPTRAGAEAVARAFPGTGAAGAAANARGLWPVAVTIPVPGQEGSRDALLPRDGSRPMLGDLEMAGNGIRMAGGRIDMGGGDIEMDGGTVVGVGTVAADVLVFTAAVATGGVCPRGGVGRDAAGFLMTCRGGRWVSAQPCNLAAGSFVARAGNDHWLILSTTCGYLPSIRFEGSNA